MLTSDIDIKQSLILFSISVVTSLCGQSHANHFILLDLGFSSRNLHGNENPGLLRTPQHRTQWAQFRSPSQSLQRDTAAMSHGLRELELISSGILQSGRARWTQFR